MGKKLAIKGHPTRGKEIIELLKMLGGDNRWKASGEIEKVYYSISNGVILYGPQIVKDTVIFTLEEFLEKYPFKIGDKVIDKADGCPGIVNEMKWDEDVSDMKYFVAFGNDIDFGWFANDSIEFCKETDTVKPVTNKSERTHEDVIFDSIIWHLRNSVNNGKQNLSGGECEDYFREVVKKNNENKMKNVLAELLEHIKTTPKEELEREFEEIKEWSNVGPTVEEFMAFCECVNKKPKYPDNYDECCEVLDYCGDYFLTTYDNNGNPSIISNILNSINILTKLLICRDAYWKIAGEKMGLGKPWESPLPSLFETVYCIRRKNNEIIKGAYRGGKSEILEFPTEEMRDAFYENFKDLIESCKKLL